MRICVVLLALATALVACKTDDGAKDSAIKEAPTGDNQLFWWGLESFRYDETPLAAELPRIPWPGDYWATFRGGVAYRWRAPLESADYRDYLYEILSPAQIAALTEDEIANLSPAEKYDLWMGRTDLTSAASATGRQRQFMLSSAQYNRDELGQDEIPTWTGICNGWSLAAIFEKQPSAPVVVKDPGGRKIRFFPGDIKALLSQIYFDYQPAINVARLGAMCTQPSPARNSRGRIKDAACRDVNPMSFHAALGKKLAKGDSFVFDVESNVEVWNQPAYGYELTYSNKRAKPSSYRNAAPGTKGLVDVDVSMKYVVESEPEVSGMSESEVKNYVETINYRYTLELDAEDRMLGGEWHKNSKIPDFLWRPSERPTDALLKSLDPEYPMSFDMVKDLLARSAGS